MESKRPQEWSVSEVGEWLESLDLTVYKPRFQELRIDGMLLFEMTEEDLINDIGVPVRLHRFKINENIKKLKEQTLQNPPESDSEEMSEEAPQEVKWEVLVLKAMEGQLANNTFLIGTSGATIGRNSSFNEIVIGESFVSRKHCEVRYNESTNQFLLNDLGSTTGTFMMVSCPLQLQLGTMFQLGLSEFKVTNVKYNPHGRAVTLELEIYEGPARQNQLSVGPQGLTIGRDPENSYSIREDSQMSGFHAKIEYSEGNFYLSDVGSTNKTWVRLSAEGERSQPYPVLVGDVVKIGSTVLAVELPDPSQVPFRDSNGPVSEDTACKICFTRECNVAYYPCGHMLCEFCARKCGNCPICRKPVQDLVRLFR